MSKMKDAAIDAANEAPIPIPAWATLDDVDQGYRSGRWSQEQVLDYIERWNATPGRFTRAVLRDGAVRNYLIPDTEP